MSYPKISKYYEEDHDRLDSLFQKFQQTKRVNFIEARQYFVEFKFGLQRHIIWEEDILFPIFEMKTGIPEGGPTSVMRQEHRQISEYLEAIHQKVQKADPNSDGEEEMLLNVLSQHNLKEEEILYPAIDRLTQESELAGVYDAMANVPAERYQTCCATPSAG